MEQLVTTAICRGAFRYRIPLIAVLSKKSLGLFPIKLLPYSFACSAFSFGFCLLCWSTLALFSSWVPSPLAVPLVASAAPWPLWPCQIVQPPGPTSLCFQAHVSHWPLHSAFLGWQTAANSWSIMYLFLLLQKEKLWLITPQEHLKLFLMFWKYSLSHTFRVKSLPDILHKHLKIINLCSLFWEI